MRTPWEPGQRAHRPKADSPNLRKRSESAVGVYAQSRNVPTTDQTEAARILEHSAPQLFIARARELGAEFAPEAMSLSAIAAICRHLDGIPRAIEFAAARAATLGIEQVASGLQEHFKLLTSGRHTALPRQRTLRATLD